MNQTVSQFLLAEFISFPSTLTSHNLHYRVHWRVGIVQFDIISRYYIHISEVESVQLILKFQVIIDIPYASSPQGIKYFTIIGPHIDSMEEKYLSPLSAQDRKVNCCWCCQRGALALRIILERTAYVCGENIRVRAQIENRQSTAQSLVIRLVQHVEVFVEKGLLGENKMMSCVVFEHK